MSMVMLTIMVPTERIHDQILEVAENLSAPVIACGVSNYPPKGASSLPNLKKNLNDFLDQLSNARQAGAWAGGPKWGENMRYASSAWCAVTFICPSDEEADALLVAAGKHDVEGEETNLLERCAYFKLPMIA